jgi:hypothetical protein
MYAEQNGILTLPCYCPDRVRLNEIAVRHAEDFKTADPFSHVVLDNLFPDLLLQHMVDEVPTRTNHKWTEWGSGARDFESRSEMKLGISCDDYLGPITRNFMLQLNSATFVSFLEQLSGFGGLIPDPTFRGGGLHSTGRGGRLLVHSDADRHPLGESFNQRLNLIVFLNQDWSEDYGGALQLWSRDKLKCVRSISPAFNRTVIFESGTDTYHGHPSPLRCPDHRTRLSLACYYYMLDRPVTSHYSGWSPRIRWIKD